MPIAAANEGGMAGIGAGLGAGFTMAQQMAGALNPMAGQTPPPVGGIGVPVPVAPVAPPPEAGPVAAPVAVPVAGNRFCMECGKSIPGRAKFCPECGAAQS